MPCVVSTSSSATLPPMFAGTCDLTSQLAARSVYPSGKIAPHVVDCDLPYLVDLASVLLRFDFAEFLVDNAYSVLPSLSSLPLLDMLAPCSIECLHHIPTPASRLFLTM